VRAVLSDAGTLLDHRMKWPVSCVTSNDHRDAKRCAARRRSKPNAAG
jgi:hypothetical protein